MVDVQPADLWAVMDDIKVEERQREKRTLLLGALAGVNINQMGPAGTGKSLLCREFCRRITGATFFSKTLHAMMPADAILGSVDIPKLVNDGEYAINVAHAMPSAHVPFLDEWPRANGPTMDALLPMLNAGERLAEGSGGMFKTPILFVVLASNFMPPADDPQFGALVDRITLMQWIDYVKADESFRAILVGHRARRIAEADGASNPVSVTLEQFQRAQDQVMRVEFPKEFQMDVSKLRREAKKEGIGISDRAWPELAQVCQASAFLGGRTECNSSDLTSCEDGLWRDPEDRATARELVLQYQSAVLRETHDRLRETEPHLAALYEARPQIEGLPMGEQPSTDLMKKIQATTRALNDCAKRVLKLLKDAEREQVNAPELRDLMTEIESANDWLSANFLPTLPALSGK